MWLAEHTSNASHTIYDTLENTETCQFSLAHKKLTKSCAVARKPRDAPMP